MLSLQHTKESTFESISSPDNTQCYLHTIILFEERKLDWKKIEWNGAFSVGGGDTTSDEERKDM